MALSKIKGTVIADDAINADRIADGTVVASDLLDNTITGAKLATDIAISTTGTIDVSGGTLTLANDQISGDKISGGTISTFSSTGIDDNATSTAITIDSSENVGIGTTSPQSRLHVRTADSGGSPITAGDELVVEGGAYNIGMSFLSTGGNGQFIYFGDDADNNIGSIKYEHGDNSLQFVINASEAMRITSSGNVGIGTSSPNVDLNVVASNGGNVEEIFELRNNSTAAGTGSRLRFVNSTVAGTTGNSVSISSYRNSDGDQDLIFETVGSEAMRIDSSGRLLVATTSTAISNAGMVLDSNGRFSATRNNDLPFLLNRLSSDGNIADFRKDGTTVGIIGSATGTNATAIYIGHNDTALAFETDSNNSITPLNASSGANRDNTIDLGSSSARFKDLYLGGGLYVGGTGSANKLDDYEEGTWTPTAVSTGDWSGFASSTINSYGATYTKVGRAVSINALVAFPDSTGTLTAGDAVKIGGLPFNYGGSGDNTYARIPSQAFARDGTNGGVSHNYLFTLNNITLRVVATHGSGVRSQTSLMLSFTYFTDA